MIISYLSLLFPSRIRTKVNVHLVTKQSHSPLTKEENIPKKLKSHLLAKIITKFTVKAISVPESYKRVRTMLAQTRCCFVQH